MLKTSTSPTSLLLFSVQKLTENLVFSRFWARQNLELISLRAYMYRHTLCTSGGHRDNYRRLRWCKVCTANLWQCTAKLLSQLSFVICQCLNKFL